MRQFAQVGYYLAISKLEFFNLTTIERYMLCEELAGHLQDMYGDSNPPSREMRKSGF